MEGLPFASSLIVPFNSSLFLVGGVNTQGQHSSKIFQYLDSWLSVASDNSDLFSPRSGHCGFVQSPFLYIYGGQLETSSEIYSSWLRLSLSDYVWEEFLQSDIKGRHSSSCVFSEKAIVFGGATAEGPSDQVLVLDPETREFYVQECTGQVDKMFMHSSVVWENSMFVYGGTQGSLSFSTLWQLKLNSWEWVSLGEFSVEGSPIKVCGHSAGVWDGKMIVFGGTDMQNTIYNSLFVYDFQGRWGKTDKQYEPRFTGALLCTDQVILAGGLNLSKMQIADTVEVAEVQEIEWF